LRVPEGFIFFLSSYALALKRTTLILRYEYENLSFSSIFISISHAHSLLS
jgi:hypothetical protein